MAPSTPCPCGNRGSLIPTLECLCLRWTVQCFSDQCSPDQQPPAQLHEDSFIFTYSWWLAQPQAQTVPVLHKAKLQGEPETSAAWHILFHMLIQKNYLLKISYCLLLLPLAGAKLILSPSSTAGLLTYSKQTFFLGLGLKVVPSILKLLLDPLWASWALSLPGRSCSHPSDTGWTKCSLFHCTGLLHSLPSPQDNPHGDPLAMLDLLWCLWGQSLTLRITEPRLIQEQGKKISPCPQRGEIGTFVYFK